MSTVGDILSTVGCSVPLGYHDKCGGCLEYRGGVQYRGDIMMHVGDIMSTVEGVQYHGGKIFCYLSTPLY